VHAAGVGAGGVAEGDGVIAIPIVCENFGNVPSISMRRCMQSRSIHSSNWWSIELPSGWSVSEESDCVTFRSNAQAGVLKVSAVRKPYGHVAEADISEFIGEPKRGGTAPTPLQTQNYFGWQRHQEHGGTFLAEWWLARESVLVYLTYERPTGAGNDELDEVQRIVKSVCIEGGTRGA